MVLTADERAHPLLYQLLLLDHQLLRPLLQQRFLLHLLPRDLFPDASRAVADMRSLLTLLVPPGPCACAILCVNKWRALLEFYLAVLGFKKCVWIHTEALLLLLLLLLLRLMLLLPRLLLLLRQVLLSLRWLHLTTWHLQASVLLLLRRLCCLLAVLTVAVKAWLLV